jgi:hypothetical protein
VDLELSKYLKILFNLFLEFSNNILHVKISQIFKNILKYKYGSENSKKVIFEEIKLVDEIVSNQNESLKIYFFEISNLLLDNSSSDKMIESYLKDNLKWKEFVTTELSEFNKILSKDIGGPVPVGKGISTQVMLALAKEEPKEEIFEKHDSDEEEEEEEEDQPTNVLNTGGVFSSGDMDDFDADFDADFDDESNFSNSFI